MRIRIPIEIVELENGNYHPVVTSVFNDGSTGKWVIDTGASKSVFDSNLQKQVLSVVGRTEDLHSAGIGAEPMKSMAAVLHPLNFGKLTVAELKVALLDLSHINELYAKTTDLRICGLLGGDFLMRFRATVSYKRKRLILRP
jgi:hypothetical protein